MSLYRKRNIRRFAVKSGLQAGTAFLALTVFGNGASRAQDSFALRSTIDRSSVTAATADSPADAAASPAINTEPANISAGTDTSVESAAAASTDQPVDLLQTTASTDPAFVQKRAGALNRRVDSAGGGRLRPEEDPFAPLGIRAGNFVIRPSLEQGLRATDNVDQSPDKKSSVLSETTLRVNIESDWVRNEFRLNGFITELSSIAGASYSEPQAGFDAAFKYDVSKDMAINATAAYALQRESATAPVDFTGTATRPLSHDISASLGFEKNAGKMLYSAASLVERQQYGDAKLVGGGTLSQKDRNNTFLGARLRGGYEVSPALKPFAEAEIGRRIFDEKTDSNGYERSSNHYGLRTGIAYDGGEKLNGEFSVGWVDEDIDDPGLKSVGGLSVASTVNWSPHRGSDVTFDAGTQVEPTTTPGSSGSLLYTADATITRQIRARLSASANLGGYYRDFASSSANDFSYHAGIGFTFWLNRYLGLVGDVRREQVYSSDTAREYSLNSAYLGLRLQR